MKSAGMKESLLHDSQFCRARHGHLTVFHCSSDQAVAFAGPARQIAAPHLGSGELPYILVQQLPSLALMAVSFSLL